MNVDQAIEQLRQSFSAHGFTETPMDFFTLLRGTIGLTDWHNMTWSIDPDLPPEKAVQVMAHELGHVVLKHGIPHHNRDLSQDAIEQEHQADSWAIDMLSKFGLPTDFVEHHDHEEVDSDDFYQAQNQAAAGLFQWRTGPTRRSGEPTPQDVRRMWWDVFSTLDNAWHGDDSPLVDALMQEARQPLRRVTLRDGSFIVLMSNGDCLRFVPGIDGQGFPYHRLAQCEPAPGDPSIYGPA